MPQGASREESEAEQAVARPQVTVRSREQHAISRKDISGKCPEGNLQAE
ncbi:hypothetical protein ACNKHV_00885 [Shigella flexneri]